MKGVFLGGVIGGTGGLLIGILIGVVIASGLSYLQSGGLDIPYARDHATVAEGFTCRDATWNVVLALKHVQTGETAFSPTAPLQVFTPHKTYSHSLWIWCSNGDIDLFMEIWGPANDGKTYMVNFGRSMCNAVTINGWGHSLSWAWDAGDGSAGIGWQILYVTLE